MKLLLITASLILAYIFISPSIFGVKTTSKVDSKLLLTKEKLDKMQVKNYEK